MMHLATGTWASRMRENTSRCWPRVVRIWKGLMARPAFSLALGCVKRPGWSCSPAIAGAWQRGRGRKSGQVWVRTPDPPGRGMARASAGYVRRSEFLIRCRFHFHPPPTMTKEAVLASQAAICVAQFIKQPNHEKKIKKLREVKSWQRAEVVEKDSWDNPGKKGMGLLYPQHAPMGFYLL